LIEKRGVFFEALGLDSTNIEHRDVAARILSSEIEHFTIKHAYTTPGKKRVMTNPAPGIVMLAQKYDLDNSFLGWYASDGKNAMLLLKRKLGDPITWH
jgi:hypothetical protein